MNHTCVPRQCPATVTVLGYPHRHPGEARFFDLAQEHFSITTVNLDPLSLAQLRPKLRGVWGRAVEVSVGGKIMESFPYSNSLRVRRIEECVRIEATTKRCLGAGSRILRPIFMYL